MRFKVRAGGFAAVAVVGLVLGSFTEAVGQNRLSRSLDGRPVTAESVERALVLMPEPGVDPAGVTEIGLSLRVQFDLDSAMLTPNAMRDLDQVAIAFNGRALAVSGVLTLEGHTDSSGEAGYNLRLSQLRANAVVAYLVSRGVAPHRLRAIGYGESRPLAFLQAADPRQRRVEIVRQF